MKKPPFQFLSVMHVTSGWNLQDHGQLHRSLDEAKSHIERTATMQATLCDEHDEKRQEACVTARTKTERRKVLERFYKSQPFWFELAEVYELQPHGSLRLVAAFNTAPKSGKHLDEWIGWE